VTEKLARAGAKPRWFLRDTSARITFYVVGLAVWVALAQTSDRFPGPVDSIRAMREEFEDGNVAQNFLTTMDRFFTGVVLSCLIGLVVGVLIGMSASWRAFLNDIVLVGLSIPSILWAFLTVMWFGFGYKAPVTAVVFTAVPFVAYNVSKGVSGVSRELHDMSDAYGVGLWRRVRELVLPGAMGYVMTGVRFAVIMGWNAVLLAEWFGSNSGVGFRSRYWYDANRFDGFVAWVAIFVVFIIVLDRLVLERFERRAFAWRGREAQQWQS
jgi:ABC-type nitrate/sulfonate/bicarbonate transport system permease component